MAFFLLMFVLMAVDGHFEIFVEFQVERVAT